jgi:hypothetical protein
MGFELPSKPELKEDPLHVSELEGYSGVKISKSQRFLLSQFAPSYKGRSAAVSFHLKVVYQDDQSIVFPITITTPGIPHEYMEPEKLRSASGKA